MQHPLNILAQLSQNIADSLGISAKAVASTLTIVVLAGLAVAALPLIRKWSSRSSNSGARGVSLLLVYAPIQPSAEATNVVKMVVLVVCYSLCSSMLLIINKVAVTYIPAASTILLCQFGSCAAFIYALKKTNVLQDVDDLETEKAKKFMPLVLAFVAILFCNVKALQYNPVDTIICLRTSTPLLIAIIEFYYLGRELPSARSWASLLGVLGGVIIYVRHDIHFGWLAYLWLGLWYFFAVFDMVFVKHVCNTVEMSTWTRTYYQNILSIPPILVLALVNGDLAVLSKPLSSTGVITLLLSCAAGLGMSYFSFALRAAISATSFSVIGNVCKILTIVVNLVIWDEHSDAVGTVALFGCLIMGSFYREAPMKNAKAAFPRSATPLIDKSKPKDVEEGAKRTPGKAAV